MMNKVVTDGTGTAAKLDFTNVAGKTGTSTGPKDVWFVGFTGKYVGAVWLGNDDNRPMASGTTGGHFAAPVWHSFMSVVHTDMNIPTIPASPHPVQVAEQQRIAAMRIEGSAGSAGRRDEGLLEPMSDPTREALKHLAGCLRKAAGIAEPVEPTPPKLPGTKPPAAPGAAPSTASPKRADGTPPGRSPTLPYDNTVGAQQPAPGGMPHRAVP